MIIKRYTLRDKKKGMHLESDYTSHSWDFEWFFKVEERATLEYLKMHPEQEGKEIYEKIGIVGGPIPAEECFVRNLFLHDSPLVIHEKGRISPKKRDDEWPAIRRAHKELGQISGPSSGLEETSKLIEFLKQQKTIHAYQASPYSSGEHPIILTFSVVSPETSLYNYDSMLPVKFENNHRVALRNLFRLLNYK